MLKSDGHRWLLSAQDLTTFMGCRHAAALNRRMLADPVLRGWLSAQRSAANAAAEVEGLPAEDPSIPRGLAHEKTVLEGLESEGRSVKKLKLDDFSEDAIARGVDETVAAMRSGVDVIYQAVLQDGPWWGLADFLIKVPEAVSGLGDYSYEVHDTKLARSLGAKALIQLAHYGLMLEQMQGAPPRQLVVVLGGGEEATWPYQDAAPYVARLRDAILAFHVNEASTAPEPVDACGSCKWLGHCDEAWGPDDLKYVHRLTRRQRTLLMESKIGDIAALAEASDAQRPARMSPETYLRLRSQARAQGGVEPYEVIRPHPAVGGFADVPAPHPSDMYFDLEGDPFAANPTLDYLWAYCDADGNYEHRWAHDPDAERRAFSWFLDELSRRDAEGGDWHVYHYNSYETASMRRIAKAWPDKPERSSISAEVERLIESRFDDLYRRVESGLRTQDGSTSLKIVEKLAGYDRTIDAAAVAKGDDSIKVYELAIAADTTPERSEELLKGIKHYNTHDVRATAAVHKWLRGLGESLAEEDLIHVELEEYQSSDRVRARIDATSELEARLTAAAALAEADGVPLTSGLSVEGARRLAAMLAWHRDEEVVQWVDFYRLCDWSHSGEPEPSEEAGGTVTPAWLDLNGGSESEGVSAIRPGTEHESVLQDLTVQDSEQPPAGSRKRKVMYKLQCRPGAWKVKAGDTVRLMPVSEAEPVGSADVVDHDAQGGLVTVSTTTDLDAIHSAVLQPFAGSPTPWESLMRLAEAALLQAPDPASVSGLRLLDRATPAALMTHLDRSDPAAAARQVMLTTTDGELLAVQGPPGTGKTVLAAEIILDEVRRGLAEGKAVRVGVTANSHKVIDNLLDKALEIARKAGVPVQAAHVDQDPDEDRNAAIETIKASNQLSDALDRVQPGSALVVGATKYGWSREDVASTLDLLVIDEAGQISLADALAVVQAAPRVLAVGDPQQLAAPIQAAHHEDVKVSLLEYLIQGEPVIPPTAGVFLDTSHRMHSAVCEVVGRLAYASSLHASKAAGRRRLEGPDIEVAGTSLPMRPGVLQLPVSGGEEAEAVAAVELVERLVAGDVLATDMDSESSSALKPITRSDVLVVAPHNATVNRLRHLLPGVEIGTVDKFQGRQAHVVVFAMGRTAQAPSDVPFLYELNRINVALSRARLLAIVVTAPDALLPPVSEPQHLLLASRFGQALSNDR